MIYSVRIKRSAAKDLERIRLADRRRVAAAIDDLAHRPLQGKLLKGGLRGLRRVRAGRHRVIYDVRDDELIVLVVRVGARERAHRGAAVP